MLSRGEAEPWPLERDNRPQGGLNQVPSAAPSCLSGKGCRSIAYGYGANEGVIKVDCVVRVQRTEPHVDAERQEKGWGGPSAHEKECGGGLPGASQMTGVVKNPPVKAGDLRDMSSSPGLGRSPGGGHGNPFQYSCLEKPMDGGAWWATAHGVAESQTRLGY